MNKENSPDFSVTVVVRKNPFWISPIYMPIIYLHRLRFLIHREQHTLIMRNRGPGAAVRHSTWKTSKIRQCQIYLGWKLCTVPNAAYEKSKISCTLSENLLHICSQFLSISALLKHCHFDLCLRHAPPVSFTRLTWVPPAFLMQVHLSEITKVNKESKISPLPHGEFIFWGFILWNVQLLFLASSTWLHTMWLGMHVVSMVKHDANLTFWHTAFSLCTPARWWY